MKFFNLKKWAPYIVFILFCIGTITFALRNPAASTDMLFYTAIAREHSNSDIQTIHNESYQMIFKRVNQSKTGSFQSKEQWVSGPQYHIDIYENIDSFQQQFPFFKIRVLYTKLISVVSITGLDLIKSSQLISIVASTIAIGLLFFSLSGKIPNRRLYWLLIGTLAFGYIEVIERASPDSLALLFMSVMTLFIIQNRFLISLVFLPILVVVRTNLIILNAPYLAFIWIKYKKFRPYTILSGLISLISYFGITKWAGHYGWATLMYHTFINPISFPKTTVFEFGISNYIPILMEQLHSIFTYNTHLLIYTLMMSLIVWNYKDDIFKNKTAQILIFTSIATIIIHILLFPLIHVRLLSGFYIMGLTGVLIGLPHNQLNYSDLTHNKRQ
ncbi:MAG: hypothetical protein VXX85_00625 [Candidatus Margulisiibacteriota bacterium]|nr:hypothetical protein [Candidatus Margulisiibacteriota bacterium]